MVQRPEVAPRGRAGDPRAPRGRGRRETGMGIVERLDDAQPLLEARDPIAFVERGFLCHAPSQKKRAKVAPDWPIIAHKHRGANRRSPARLLTSCRRRSCPVELPHMVATE